MNTWMKKIPALLLTLILLLGLAAPAFAAGSAQDGASPSASEQAEDETAENGDDAESGKALASAIAIGLAAAGGAIGMGIAAAKSVESIARQPEAEGKIRTTLMLGLVFIETAIIYALLVVILIIFVL